MENNILQIDVLLKFIFHRNLFVYLKYNQSPNTLKHLLFSIDNEMNKKNLYNYEKPGD